jgi:hypothetical protein
MNIVFKTFALILFFSFGLFAQNYEPNTNYAIIDYSVNISADNNPEINQAAPFVNATKIQFLFLEKKSRWSVKMMGGLANVDVIYDEETKDYIFLLNIPTVFSNTAVTFNENDDILQKLKEDQPTEDYTDMLTYKKVKRKKKKIAGRKCNIMHIEMPEFVSPEPVVVYFDKKFRPTVAAEQLNKMEEITGFPLGFDFSYEEMSMSIMATKINKEKPNASLFTVPEGYEMKTLEEFKEILETKFEGQDKVFGL